MDTRSSADKRVNRSLSARLVIWSLTMIAYLPLRILYLLSDLAYLILYRVVGYRKRVVRHNLEIAFPEASEPQRRKWEREFYHHLCDTFIESMKLLHISDREVYDRVEICNSELVDEAVRAGHSVVLMLGHYGNWEWVSSIATCFKVPVVTAQIYHPLSSHVMDELMLQIRSRFGAENVAMKTAVRHLLGIEREGRKFVCGFIADQRPTGNALHHWTDFFGIDTAYLVGGESIGEHIGARYVYLDVEKRRRGRYRLTFRPIEKREGDTGEYPMTRQYLRMLEATIRRAPAYWLWSHNRWKSHR